MNTRLLILLAVLCAFVAPAQNQRMQSLFVSGGMTSAVFRATSTATFTGGSLFSGGGTNSSHWRNTGWVENSGNVTNTAAGQVVNLGGTTHGAGVTNSAGGVRTTTWAEQTAGVTNRSATATRQDAPLLIRGGFTFTPTIIATVGAVLQDTNSYQWWTTNADFSVLFGGTPTEGSRGQFDIKNTAETNIIVTWPVSWSISQAALITTFTAISNSITEVFWYYEGGSNRVRVATKEIVESFASPTAGQYVIFHDANTKTNVTVSAGATAWDDVADPDAISTLAFAGFQQTISSTLDGGTSLTITNTDADNASDTIMLKIAFNDLADANSYFAQFIDDADGTPVSSFLFGPTLFTLGSGVTVTLPGPVTASGTLFIPQGTADVAMSAVGQMHLNETDEQLGLHSGANGEISGEAAVSLIYTKSWTFDPKAVCDGAVDRLFLMWVQDEAPEGIIIDEWKLSFEADPTTEIDADLMYADAMIGVANPVTVDALDSSVGVSSEDTDANINGGAVIPNGKVLYIEFDTAYTEANHQIMFQVWYHLEED